MDYEREREQKALHTAIMNHEKAKLREKGMVIKKTGYGTEHRVNFHRGAEETAAYENSLEDAIGTGHAMHKRAEELRMAGKGSHDPVYENSKKNK
jgi:hypothetical protein